MKPKQYRTAYDQYVNQLVKDQYLAKFDQIEAGKKIQSLFSEVVVQTCTNPRAWESLFQYWTQLKDQQDTRLVLVHPRKRAGRRTEQSVDRAFERANESDSGQEKAELLLEVSIHPRYFLEDVEPCNLISIRKQSGDDLSTVQEVNELRSNLVNSVLKLITKAASEKYRELSGDIIEFSDLFSEAWSATWDTTLRYDAMKDVLFTTLVKPRIYGHLNNYVAESGRTVKVSRSLLEKSRLVREAINETGSYDPVILAKAINVQRSRKKARKLKLSEIIPPSTVEQILEVMSPTVSLDAPVGEDETPISHHIEDREQCVENELIFDDSMSRFREVLPSFLKQREWDILSIRWGLATPFDEPQSIQTTILEYRRRHPGCTVNRNQINEMEYAVRLRLRASGHLRDLYETLVASRNHQS